MKHIGKYLCALLFVLISAGMATAQQKHKITLVIHGGAGTILKKDMTPELEKQYHAKLDEALETGYKILKNGGTSLDAVEATVKILEDSPLFNAGKGAVFTNDGKNELDAAIMDGKTLQAGAVARLTTVKNPITAARAVMQQSPHVMLTGKEADEFAKLKGLEIVDPSYFRTEHRYQDLQRILKAEQDTTGSMDPVKRAGKFGTVGAVALDQYGNIAAATSTGGMTNKRYGRVGDSPIIGAGTYANNNTCAVSATGHGEYFIRAVVGHDISALMEYKKYSVKKAAEEVVMKKLVKMGGEGGIIALDRKGNITMTFNSEGMYRGYIREGEKKTLIYKD